MTIYDIINERAAMIIMSADYTSTPPRSPQLRLLRDHHPLSMSIPDIDELLWREAERIADEVIFGRFKP